MTESQKLFSEYTQSGSEAAFRDLVTRYLNLVYSTALRLVEGDTHRAEDVAQIVFLDLARMARTLSSGVMLGGWLHRHTCFVAANTMRGERRRQLRERQAVEMNALQDNSGEAGFSRVAPILDKAINELAESDRTAVLLRFFEEQDFRAVGQALGSTEDAARMRVNRALEKLQDLLKRRGVTTSAATLSVVLAGNAVQAAPVGLALSISTAAALAGTAITSSATATAVLKTIAMTTLQKTIITAAVAAAIGTGIYQARQSSRLREQVQTLEQQQAPLNEQIGQLRHAATNQVARLTAKSLSKPRRPVPPLQPVSVPTALPSELLASSNLYSLMTNKQAKLTAAQVMPYLDANRRSAASLLAAFRTSGEPSLLEEAMQKYPKDPQVAFEAVIRKETTTEERRHWLDIYKEAAPENALPNYLSALDYFKSGQADQAVQDLMAASAKGKFQDYTLERSQDDEEAYRAAGYPVADAKIVAISHLLLPQLAQVRDLGQSILDLASSYRQAGDEASSQAALQMAMNLGHRYSDPSAGQMLISQLVGIAVERNALSAMEPNSSFGTNGQTVQNRLDQLTQQRAAFRELGKQADPFWERMTDQDWISYHSRSAAFGEETAMRWLVAKYGSK